MTTITPAAGRRHLPWLALLIALVLGGLSAVYAVAVAVAATL